uniref:Uncharacterized protein n=1 Tax=Rhizophora mucronata TaxID=61149 RepID=A0A2P2L149_RHIMU
MIMSKRMFCLILLDHSSSNSFPITT